MSRMIPQTQFRVRAVYYTPMLKPLGVNVPGSPNSTMVGSAPLMIETRTDNPLVALAQEVSEATLTQLPVKILRKLVTGIQTLSPEKVAKSGTKSELIQRILVSPYKEGAVHQFLAEHDVSETCKQERVKVNLFMSLRGALRQAGTEILRDLRLPYSVPALSEDQLPEGAHRMGDCPDPEHPCLVCRVFGALNQESLFKNYTPPLVNDSEHKLDLPQEVNPVFIRMHRRNVHRPDGNTLNFNQQYFAGTFITYLRFPAGLPDTIELGFLFNCLERCDNVGAAKAWGAGKLFLQAYTLEQVEVTYTREWTGDAFQMTPQTTVTPLKIELEHAFSAYAQWLAQVQSPSGAAEEGEVVA